MHRAAYESSAWFLGWFFFWFLCDLNNARVFDAINGATLSHSKLQFRLSSPVEREVGSESGVEINCGGKERVAAVVPYFKRKNNLPNSTSISWLLQYVPLKALV